MKTNSVTLPVPNGLLFIQDPSIWDPPEPVDDSGIWASPAGITFGCMHRDDGDTDVAMGKMQTIEQASHLVFDGQVDTPKLRIVVQIVPGTIILEQFVTKTKTRVKIWTDGSPRPGKVIVGVD